MFGRFRTAIKRVFGPEVAQPTGLGVVCEARVHAPRAPHGEVLGGSGGDAHHAADAGSGNVSRFVLPLTDGGGDFPGGLAGEGEGDELGHAGCEREGGVSANLSRGKVVSDYRTIYGAQGKEDIVNDVLKVVGLLVCGEDGEKLAGSAGLSPAVWVK